ncbi:ATP-binding response regulator [Noviherbaspirillum sp.]|uniref:ATP-binding response regulator n=1 Tax=Noviherbaspirillum sp. TaxID=1926288 RepID=UPI002FE30B83
MTTLLWAVPWGLCAFIVPSDFYSQIVVACILLSLSTAIAYAMFKHTLSVVSSVCVMLLPFSVLLFISDNRFFIPFLGGMSLLLYIYVSALRQDMRNGKDLLRDKISILHPYHELEESLQKHVVALDKAEKALLIAEQACIEKTRFLAAASHDLRQPMHAVTLFVAALKAEVLDGQAYYLLDRLDRSLAGLDELFNRLLDIGRLDTGVITPAVKTFDALSMLETLESRFSAVAASKSLDFRICCKPGLQIRSDPVLLTELVSNLLSNAFRYTERGGIMLCIRQRESGLQIRVIDTGCGIAEYHFESIFEEFVQLNNPSRDRRKGSGLGLAIVRRLAHILDHSVKVRSAVGRGSCFEVRVPGSASVVDHLHDAYSDSGVSDLKGALVLVVDDEVDILAAMEALLRSWGCHCIAARSSEEAARFILDSPRFPDVVITDHRLANHHTCFDVTAAVLPLLPYSVPVIVISGECSPCLEKEVTEMGYGFISKPVNAAKLYAAIADAFQEATENLGKAA